MTHCEVCSKDVKTYVYRQDCCSDDNIMNKNKNLEYQSRNQMPNPNEIAFYCDEHFPIENEYTWFYTFNVNKEKAVSSEESKKCTSFQLLKLPKELIRVIFLDLELIDKVNCKSLNKYSYHQLTAWSPIPPLIHFIDVTYSCASNDFPQIVVYLRKEGNAEIDSKIDFEKKIVTLKETKLVTTGPSTATLPENNFFRNFFSPQRKDIQPSLFHVKFHIVRTRPTKYGEEIKLNLSSQYCGKKNVAITVINTNWSGGNAIESIIPYIPEYKVKFCACFNSMAPIKKSDGSFAYAKDITVGDTLMTPSNESTRVVSIETTQVNAFKKLVELGDFDITLGHPIFFEGEWYRPDELFSPINKCVDAIFNFYCEPSHEIIVGKEKEWICGSLGSYCPRLASADLYSDILFGRGYGSPLAKRYSWLLELSSRIPNETVETETEKYWLAKGEYELAKGECWLTKGQTMEYWLDKGLPEEFWNERAGEFHCA